MGPRPAGGCPDGAVDGEEAREEALVNEVWVSRCMRVWGPSSVGLLVVDDGEETVNTAKHGSRIHVVRIKAPLSHPYLSYDATIVPPQSGRGLLYTYLAGFLMVQIASLLFEVQRFNRTRELIQLLFKEPD